MELKASGAKTNPYQWNLIYWLSYLLFAMPFFLGKVFIFLIVRPTVTFIDRIMKRSAELKGRDSAEAPSVPGRLSITMPKDDPVVWDRQQIPLSEMGRFEVSTGYVVFRFFPDQGVTKGKLTIVATSKSRLRKRPITVQLEGACGSMREAIGVLKEKAEQAIVASQSEHRNSKKGKAVSEEANAAKTEAVPMFDDYLDPPLHLLADDAARFSAEESMPDPFEELRTPVSVPTPKQRLSDASPAQVSYKGQLLSFGRQERELDDGKNGERKIRHFSLQLFDEGLQGEQTLWGNDLQRALRESGAAVGDRVEVCLVGETPVTVKGKQTKKKIYSVIKL